MFNRLFLAGFALLLSAIAQISNAQNVKWTADVGAGLDFPVSPYINTLDSKGNVYVAGLTWGNLYGSLGGCFLSKYTSQGTLAYGMQWGGMSGQPYGPDGNCELAGAIVDNSDRLWLAYKAVGVGGQVAIVNQSNRQTAQNLISLPGRYPLVIQRDKFGSVYVWSIQTSGSIQTSFISKFDGQSGAVIWETSFQFASNSSASYIWEFGSKIAFDHYRGVMYVAGDNNTEGIGAFGYLAALNMNNGAMIWRRPADPNVTALLSVDVDETNNAGTIWISGVADNPNNPPGSSSGMWAIVAKLDQSGYTLWSDTFGTTSAYVDTQAADIKVGSNGVVNVVGFTSGDLFGPPLYSSNKQDGFARFYDSNGVPLGAVKFGSPTNDQPVYLSLDKSGDLLITGFYFDYDFLEVGPTLTSGSLSKRYARLITSLERKVPAASSTPGSQFFTSKLTRYTGKKSAGGKKQ